MTILAIVLGVVLLATLATSVITVRLLLLERRETERDWAKERDRLLERIQRPERIPPSLEPVPVEATEPEPDEWHLVGQVDSISDDYGIGEED